MPDLIAIDQGIDKPVELGGTSSLASSISLRGSDASFRAVGVGAAKRRSERSAALLGWP